MRDLYSGGVYSGGVRILAVIVVAVLSGCAPAPPPVATKQLQHDPTTEEWYSRESAELTGLAREATALHRRGLLDDASATISRAQPIQGRLLAVPRPSLAAMQAASDLDHLYGTMLLDNLHFGWARLLFQKNLGRWKNWQPQTDDTARRLDQAKAAIAECDRRMAK